MSLNIPQTDRKRIVIVGGGFAGLALIRALRRSAFQIILVDKHNYHMFKPLLYQVASSALNVGDIAFPFRKMFHGWKNIYFRMGYIERIDPEKHRLETTAGTIGYDYLILATGSIPNFFKIENIKRNALPMSNITDALNIRNRMLRNFEMAVTATTKEECSSRLNAVIVGAGASGVEIAGALAEMRRYVMPRDYPQLDTSQMNIYLIEEQNRVLGSMSEKTSEEALKTLSDKGIRVILGRKIVDYENYCAVFDDGARIPTYNLIWTCGIKSAAFPGIPPVWIGRGGRIRVDAFNRVIGCEDLFAIGDTALMLEDPNYPQGHPQLARVAISQGKRLAHNLKNSQTGRPMQPYRYKNYGVMATVGRNKAFVEWDKVQFGGFFAWIVWSVVHIMFLLGIQGKLKVFWGWIWNYFGHDLPIRLIIGKYERQQKTDTL